MIHAAARHLGCLSTRSSRTRIIFGTSRSSHISSTTTLSKPIVSGNVTCRIKFPTTITASSHRTMMMSSKPPPPPPQKLSVAAAAKTAAGSGKGPGFTAATTPYIKDRGPVSWPSLFLVGIAAASLVAYYNIERERRLESAMGRVVSSESGGWTPNPDTMAPRKFKLTKWGWFPEDDGFGPCKYLLQRLKYQSLTIFFLTYFFFLSFSVPS
jgi:hypothetical protein